MSDPNLTLYYNFVADKSLAARIGPTLGITRTTEGRFFDALGILQTAASGIARFDHNPVTGESLGLLVEEARTNLCLQSQNVSAAPWTTLITPVINPVSTIAPDGTLTMNSINDNNGAGFEGVVQQITIPDDSATYTFSLYIEKTAAGTAPTMGVNVVLIGGTNPGDLPIPRIFTDTGFVEDLQAGANSRIEDAGDYWRLISTVGNNSTGNTIIEVQIFPATAANGFLPNVAAAVGINRVWGMQMETGAFATSYIPTTTVTVTRNADAVSTADVSWLNETEGTYFTKAEQEGFDAGASGVLEVATNSTNRHLVFSNAVDPAEAFWQVMDTATLSANLNVANQYLKGVIVKTASCYKLNDFEHFVDGTRAGTGDQLGTVPTGLTTLRIGRSAAVLEVFNGHIAEIRYYNVRKDNTFLESLSNGIINEDSINLSSDLANSIARKIARPH